MKAQEEPNHKVALCPEREMRCMCGDVLVTARDVLKWTGHEGCQLTWSGLSVPGLLG